MKVKHIKLILKTLLLKRSLGCDVCSFLMEDCTFFSFTSPLVVFLI